MVFIECGSKVKNYFRSFFLHLDAYSSALYRPYTALFNFRPVVYEWSTFFLAWNGSGCDVAGGSTYDINYYCGFIDRETVHKCIDGRYYKQLGNKKSAPRNGLIMPEHVVLCEENTSSEDVTAYSEGKQTCAIQYSFFTHEMRKFTH